MKSVIEAKVLNAQPGFWREWGPVIACALLTGVGLYGLLVLANVPLVAFGLFALTLSCPLVTGLAWWLSGRVT